MGLFNLKLRKFEIPLYDIGTIVAGFYIGYNEGKGIDVSPFVEYFTKYGPTTFAVAVTPMSIKLTNTFGKMINNGVSQNLQSGDLEVTLQDGYKRKYGDLDEKQKEKITPKINDVINNLETKLQNPRYLKSTLSIGIRTAIETTVGYFAGRIYGQIN